MWCRVVLRTKTRAEGGIGNYLAEAAAAIFKPTKSDVPWQGTASPFSGRITHHDEVARLRRVYELVQEAKQAVQGPPALRRAHAPLSLHTPGSVALRRATAAPRANLERRCRLAGCFAPSGLHAFDCTSGRARLALC